MESGLVGDNREYASAESGWFASGLDAKI